MKSDSQKIINKMESGVSSDSSCHLYCKFLL